MVLQLQRHSQTIEACGLYPGLKNRVSTYSLGKRSVIRITIFAPSDTDVDSKIVSLNFFSGEAINYSLVVFNIISPWASQVASVWPPDQRWYK